MQVDIVPKPRLPQIIHNQIGEEMGECFIFKLSCNLMSNLLYTTYIFNCAYTILLVMYCNLPLYLTD